MMGKAQVKVPKQAVQGEVFQIKTKFHHPMETGWRKDSEIGRAHV